MNISSQIQEFSSAPTQSFFVYTINNDGVFQRYAFLDRFDAQMSENSAHGLVVYEDPARLVDEALADGSFDESGLRGWLNEAVQALHTVRRYRNRMLVVEKNASSEQRFKSQFAAVFGNQTIPPECAPHAKQETTLRSLIAFFSVQQFEPVAQALAELEASSIATNNSSQMLEESLEFVAKELAALQSRIPADEFDAMKQQLHGLENDSRELAALKPKLEKLEQENHSNVSDSNDILMRQILDLENVLRDAENEEKRTAKENARLNAEVEELKKTLNLVYGSTSWRLTAPVRAIKSTLSQ